MKLLIHSKNPSVIWECIWNFDLQRTIIIGLSPMSPWWQDGGGGELLQIPVIYTCHICDPLSRSDAILQHRSWSTLAHVLACCLITPSHGITWTNISSIILISTTVFLKPRQDDYLGMWWNQSFFKSKYSNEKFHWSWNSFKICRC